MARWVSDLKRPKCSYCGKQSFSSRKWAEAAAKANHPNSPMSAYKCLEVPDWADDSMFWHYGHLSDLVKRGKVDRTKLYGGNDGE